MHPRRLLTPAAAVPFAEGPGRVGRLEVATALRAVGRGLRLDWSVRNPGRSPVTLDRLGVAVDATFEQVLEHGWQSWSVVRRCRPGDVRPERSRVPSWRRARDFTEAATAGRTVNGEPFLLTDSGIAGFLSAGTHLGRIEASPGGDGLVAWALLDRIVLGPGEERRLEPLWLAGGEPGARYSEYAALAGAEAGARAATPAPPGWCSWYHHYSSVTPEAVRAVVPAAVAAGLRVVQIDDGYQAAIGEWRTPRSSWAGGTAAVAADIRTAGLRAGIWTAPFLADERGRLVAAHPDWVLRGRAGRPRRAMHNPRWWGGWSVALDTTHPGVLDHLRSTFAALAAEGFDYHKIDFLYAAALPGRRHDLRRTRAEALRGGLEAVRDGLGAGAFLLGCGSPLLPAVGVVDAMRVSPDVAPWWAPPRPRPGMAEAASCARNAIVTSALRAPFHRRWWINDVDCLLIRPVDTALAPGQRRAVAASVAGGGGFTIVSDDLATYGEEERSLLAAVLAAGRHADAPLDVPDPFGSVLSVRSPATRLEVDTSQLDGENPAVRLEIVGARLAITGITYRSFQ
ncbi:MAG: glycoside hydrolase family 36 protein [Actinomycetota bacterium]|jgi:alpha-galactosidase